MAFAGRLFGLVELFVLAVGGLALVGVALVSVRVSRLSLDARRELHPPRVHAGSDSRVEVVLANRSGRRTTVFTIRDPFDHGRDADAPSPAARGGPSTLMDAYEVAIDQTVLDDMAARLHATRWPGGRRSTAT